MYNRIRASFSKDKIFIKNRADKKAENLKKIEVLHILKKKEDFDIDSDVFYYKSGFKIFLEPLLKKVGDDIYGGFIEISTIASSLFDNSLDAFNIDFALNTNGHDKFNADDFSENISQYFKPIILSLRDKNLILFNHPGFITQPAEAVNIVSIICNDKNGNTEIYNKTVSRQVLAAIEKEYNEIDQLVTPKDKRSETYETEDEELDICLTLRKTSINDALTTYDGITNTKPGEVLIKTNEIFGSAKSDSEKIFALHYLNHKIYHSKFQDQEQVKSSLFLSIPIIDPHPDRNENGGDYLGIGAVFVYLLLNENFDPGTLRQKIEEYTDDIPKIIKSYLTGYVFQLGIDKYKTAEKNATRAEQAAIRAEQSAIRAAISQVNARTTSHNTGSHILANDIEDEEKIHLKEFKYYLRQRMLYNADLTTDSTKAYTPVTLHDILESFERLVIVRKYISGVNNKTFKEFINKNAIRNCLVSIPNNVLGFHAMYIVFENLIRNYFKHARGSGTQLNNDQLSLKVYQVPFDSPLYNCFEVTDGSIIDAKKFERIQFFIDAPILNDGVLRKEGLGYLEIKAALCYLNDLPLDKIDTPLIDNAINVFTVQPVTEKDKTLRYRFYLKKPVFLKISNSNSLNPGLMEKGIVDSKKATSLDTYCSFYCSTTMPEYHANITPRIINNRISFTDTDSVDDKINFLYKNWLKKIKVPKYIVCRFEGINKDQVNPFSNIFKISKTGANNGDRFSLTPVTLKALLNKNIILFDSHGYNILRFLNLSKRSKFDFFYEDYSSTGNTGKVIDNLSRQKAYLTEQLAEAAFTNVIILDERIQRYADKRYKEVKSDLPDELGELTTREVLKWMNIHIPAEEELNMNNEKFENSFKAKAGKYIKACTKENRVNFVIIHLGIIEKLTVNKDSHTISKLVDEITGEGFNKTNVVVTSERGTPDNLESYYRFLHFSNVSKHIIEDKSKIGLVNALFNSRCLITRK